MAFYHDARGADMASSFCGLPAFIVALSGPLESDGIVAGADKYSHAARMDSSALLFPWV